MNEQLAIAGSGAIACGLAATAAHHGPVLLLARSNELGRPRARDRREDARRLDAEVDPEHVQIVTDPQALAEATFVVEAVVEDHDVKAGLLGELDALLAPQAILASTTSSLSIERLAEASGRPERFLGLHVFNPVTKMKLVELVFPTPPGRNAQPRAGAVRGVREDARGGARRPRLRRQPPAVPVPVQRRAPARRDGHGPGRHRHLHAARRRTPDGAAGAARPRRPRRLQGDRRDDRRADPPARRAADRRGRARAQERARISTPTEAPPASALRPPARAL